MDFGTLTVISAVALLGPLLAIPRRWYLPVVLGELIAGIVVGRSGFGSLNPDDTTFTFLADVGFALVMFVAGSHVPVRPGRLRPALRIGVLRAALVGGIAAALAALLSPHFGSGHTALYALLMASSSAALILPTVESLTLGGDRVLELLPQIAVADAACILALPVVIDPAHAGRAALGAAVVLGSTAALFLVLRQLERRGSRRRLHRMSEQRRFALELRISLLILFGLAAIATAMHVSVLLAGFGFGVAVALIGPPRRLAKQLFAVSEGFFGPLFFVWLGASLDLRALAQHPAQIVLGVALGVGAVIAHLSTRLTGAPLPLGLLAGAQLGVPVAAATLGGQQGLLSPGEPAALLLAALITIGAATSGGSLAARAGMITPPKSQGQRDSAADSG